MPALLTSRSIRPCLARICLGRLVDVVLVADIERDRLGLAALFGDIRHHRVQLFLAAARNHHDPAVRRQKFRPGLADSAAAAGHPGHAFPVICHANCLRCFVKGVFANPASEIRRPPPLRECCMNTTANANLFSRLFDKLDDPNAARDRNARWHPHQLWRSDCPRRPDGECAGRARRQARRPRRGADREIGCRRWCSISRRVRAGAVYPAAQHRLHAERARLLHLRRRAVAGRRAIPPRREGIGAIAAKVGRQGRDARTPTARDR